MKKLTCEICGSEDLIKNAGVFVCQRCGTKYSVEEARRMMAEGAVEVVEAVRTEQCDILETALKNARRAKDDSNDALAEKYYEKVLDIDPDHWEAVYYNTYFRARQCKIAQIQSAAIVVNNCLDTVLELVKVHVTDVAEQKKAITEIAERTIEISIMFCSAAKNHYDGISTQIQHNYNQEYLNNISANYNALYYLGDLLEQIFGDIQIATEWAVGAWKIGISWHNSVMKLFADKEANKRTILKYADQIKKYEETYQPPSINTDACYVATAIYGSYNCPQVWTLRRYRDSILATTWWGKVFIRLYYLVSPAIIKVFGRSEWINRIVRNKLDAMIERLHCKGISDTPYIDRS